METGELVRRIYQDDHSFLGKLKIDMSKHGVVVKVRKENHWVSGAGPIDFQYALVSWDDNTIGWLDVTCLTNWGL
jgi:hypothetical protein